MRNVVLRNISWDLLPTLFTTEKPPSWSIPEETGWQGAHEIPWAGPLEYLEKPGGWVVKRKQQ